MLRDEEKNSMGLDIEAKYVGRTEKEFLNNITYAECLYILDTKNKYCDDIKNLSLLKIVDIVNEQSKQIEELKKQDLSNNKIIANMSTRHFNDREKIRKYEALQDKIKAKIEELNEKSFKNDINYTEFYYKKEVLQSLLEEDK